MANHPIANLALAFSLILLAYIVDNVLGRVIEEQWIRRSIIGKTKHQSRKAKANARLQKAKKAYVEKQSA